MTEPILVQCYIALSFMSCVLSIVFIMYSKHGLTRRAKLDELAVQSAHKGFVPRVGGLAIYLSIFGFISFATFSVVPFSMVLGLNISEIVWIVSSAIPVFLVGIVEDLGFPVSPKNRLIACVISGLSFIFIFQVWVSYVSLPVIDLFLAFTPFGIAFTVFATVGVVNAFNLIDGLNGLSSYIAISTSVAISMVAFEVGYSSLAIFLLLLSAAVFGFFVLNFPFGKIFLGDSGAYALGHILVWCSILLVNYEKSISPFAILLIFFWPVADTGLAIWRRRKLGNPTDRPDRLHFHQLTMRFLEIRLFGRDKRHITNPLATIIIIPLISVPQILGVLFWNESAITIWITFVIGLIFVATYNFGLHIAKKTRSIK